MKSAHCRDGNFRLYITTVINGRQNAEGPYRFRTRRAALAWLADQTTFPVLEASLFHHEQLIAQANADGPVEIA